MSIIVYYTSSSCMRHGVSAACCVRHGVFSLRPRPTEAGEARGRRKDRFANVHVVVATGRRDGNGNFGNDSPFPSRPRENRPGDVQVD
jgi:hypothetical protein